MKTNITKEQFQKQIEQSLRAKPEKVVISEDIESYLKEIQEERYKKQIEGK